MQFAQGADRRHGRLDVLVVMKEITQVMPVLEGDQLLLVDSLDGTHHDLFWKYNWRDVARHAQDYPSLKPVFLCQKRELQLIATQT